VEEQPTPSFPLLVKLSARCPQQAHPSLPPAMARETCARLADRIPPGLGGDRPSMRGEPLPHARAAVRATVIALPLLIAAGRLCECRCADRRTARLEQPHRPTPFEARSPRRPCLDPWRWRLPRLDGDVPLVADGLATVLGGRPLQPFAWQSAAQGRIQASGGRNHAGRCDPSA